MGTSGTPLEYVILFCRWFVSVCSFIESDLSDTDSIVPFENTTPINQTKKVKVKEYRANWSD